MVFWLAVILLLVEILCFFPAIIDGLLDDFVSGRLPLHSHNADFMRRCLSTVLSEELN